jgi:hypothetical protein
MGKVSIICIFLVFALLLEDGSSVRKKTEKEEEEDRKIAEAVNRTLVAEEEKRRKEDEELAKKKKGEEEKGKKRTEDLGRQEGQGQACVTSNVTCPVVECPAPVECDPCGPCAPCGPCPEEKTCPEEKICPKEKVCLPCRPCGPCPPEKPCPSLNQTSRTASEGCPEASGLSVPIAMVVGALISLGTMGLAAVVGLILRYVPPLISGILFLTVVFVVWFLSSNYPDTARELGGRAVTLIREAALALSHRAMAVIRRHQDQVGGLISLVFFE